MWCWRRRRKLLFINFLVTCPFWLQAHEHTLRGHRENNSFSRRVYFDAVQFTSTSFNVTKWLFKFRNDEGNNNEEKTSALSELTSELPCEGHARHACLSFINTIQMMRALDYNLCVHTHTSEMHEKEREKGKKKDGAYMSMSSVGRSCFQFENDDQWNKTATTATATNKTKRKKQWTRIPFDFAYTRTLLWTDVKETLHAIDH